MKANKMISLDLELFPRLEKESNASGLVNSLLTSYFKKKDKFSNNRNYKQEKEEIDEEQREQEEYEMVLSSIPEMLLEDFHSFPDMTEESLKSRWETHYRKQVDWETVQYAWEIFNGT